MLMLSERIKQWTRQHQELCEWSDAQHLWGPIRVLRTKSWEVSANQSKLRCGDYYYSLLVKLHCKWYTIENLVIHSTRSQSVWLWRKSACQRGWLLSNLLADGLLRQYFYDFFLETDAPLPADMIATEYYFRLTEVKETMRLRQSEQSTLTKARLRPVHLHSNLFNHLSNHRKAWFKES
jgi:hypothetical protein